MLKASAASLMATNLSIIENVEGKFFTYARKVMEQPQAGRLTETSWRLETFDSLQDFTRLLVGRGRSRWWLMASAGCAARTVNALAAGGKVDVSLAKTFWSPGYGMATDKCGFGWMVMVPGQHGEHRNNLDVMSISASPNRLDHEARGRPGNKLTSDGGAPSMCGWLQDRWGLSWQIVPRELPKLLTS